MARRTKIVATLGPATQAPNVLEKMIAAGVNVVRLNFSHGSAEAHTQQALQVRALSKKYQTHVAILGDLQGPKIRVSTFRQGSVELTLGKTFCLDADRPVGTGDEQGVGLDYKELADDVDVGDTLLLDDGRIQLVVTEIVESKVICEITVGGFCLLYTSDAADE